MKKVGYLSTAEAARTLGVGVSTIKRWVDEEILPACKTPGGHRKVLLADVLRLVKGGRLPGPESRELGLELQDPKALSNEFSAALATGDGTSIRHLLRGAYHDGWPLALLADQVLAPAWHRLGIAWEKGQIDILHEHVGIQICATTLYELKAGLGGLLRPDAPLALGGAPEGDPYFLANLLIEMVLLENGWRVINLGPNTPMASFRRAMAEFHPRLLWLSVSFLPDPESFQVQYRELYEGAEKAGVSVALGGQALTASLRSGLPYTTFGDGLRHLAAFVQTLYLPPSLPRRGRPRGSSNGSPKKSGAAD